MGFKNEFFSDLATIKKKQQKKQKYNTSRNGQAEEEHKPVFHAGHKKKWFIKPTYEKSMTELCRVKKRLLFFDRNQFLNFISPQEE